MTKLSIYNFRKYSNLLGEELSNLLSEYVSKTNSTGCNKTDYNTLYMNIRNFKFKEIYEAGTGVSTLIIAYALYKNYKEFKIKGRVTSMEEIKKYYDQSINLLPNFLKPFVDFRLSEVVFDYHMIFCGNRYKNIPDRKYDFCWIDGPRFNISDKKGRSTSDFDCIYLIRDRNLNISGLVDGRIHTVYMLKEIFGEKIEYYVDPNDEGCTLGVINNISKLDIKGNKSKFKGDLYLEAIRE